METILLQDQYDQFPGFEICIALIRTGEADLQEQGYWWLEDRANQHTEQLILLIQAETNPFIRGFFVELLGDAKDPAAIPALVSELSHSDQQVRFWAVAGLEKIGTEREKTLIQEHKAAHPDEW